MHELVKNKTAELAREAVKNFRAMLPMLNAYVQVMTGNKKARVIMTMEAPRTDGVNVWMRPPAELGIKAQHEKMLCDKRDKVTWLQRCPACAQRELVLSGTFHEIAHIVYESMTPATESEKVQFLKQAANVGNIEAIKKRIASMPIHNQFQWLGMANAISPYFQLLLNALEDVRVNQRMFQARKGTYAMYLADEMRLLREGIERIDPVTGELTRVKYADTPLDSQAIISVYLLGMDIYEDQYFAPTVAAAMQDKELRFLADDIRTVKSAQGAVNLAFKVLVRLRELGFLLEPEERPEPEPEQDDEPDDTEPGESGSNGDSSNQGEPDDATPDSGDEGNDAGEAEKQAGEGDGPGAGVSDQDDDDSSTNQTSGDGDSRGEPSSASDGSGPDAADAGEDSGSDGGNDNSGDESLSEDSDGHSDSDSGDEGDHAERQSSMGSNDSNNPQDGGDVPPEEVGPDAGAGRGADRTIGGGANDAANDEGELTDDLDRSDGHEGSDESDTDSRDAGPNRDSHSTSESSHSERDGAEASPAGDDNGDEEDLNGGEGADSQSAPEAQASQPSGPGYGTPEEAQELLEQVLGHQKLKQLEGEIGPSDQDEFEEAVNIAISQSEHFDAPGQYVAGIQFAEYNDGWRKPGRSNLRIRKDEEDTIEAFMPPESALGPALLKMRRTFQDNARGGKMTNLKSGKIDNRVLGKRAWSGDERLFRQPIRVAKKDYFVVIGLDISGSTAGLEINLIKRAGMAQAELLHRLKIPFAVYAHTGGWREGDELYGMGMLDAYIFPVKTAEQPWDTAAKQRLAELKSQSVNLDGHTIEYYRKRLDEKVVRKETEGILMYYTDGAMPLTNFDEELEILQREIATCKKKGYTEMAVGIGTDSPIEHGFDTVVVNGDEDLIQVVNHLERRLLR